MPASVVGVYHLNAITLFFASPHPGTYGDYVATYVHMHLELAISTTGQQNFQFSFVHSLLHSPTASRSGADTLCCPSA